MVNVTCILRGIDLYFKGSEKTVKICQTCSISMQSVTNMWSDNENYNKIRCFLRYKNEIFKPSF